MPFSSAIPVNIKVLLQKLPLFFLQHRNSTSHFYGCISELFSSCNSCLCLLLVFCAEHTENDGYTSVECKTLDTLSCSISYKNIMPCLSLYNTPQTNERIISRTLKQSLSYAR